VGSGHPPPGFPHTLPAVLLAILLVPTLFVHFTDLVSLSQSRRAAGFLPFTFAFAGGLALLARSLLVLPAALAAGIVLEREWPGDFAYGMAGTAPRLFTWIALAGGDACQLDWIRARAAERGITITIMIDFIHVLEYLWKAAWCFHPPRDPVMEDWVIVQSLDILHGRVQDVISRITRLAADHPPQRSEHAKIIRTTLSYLENKQACMDYPTALANGWPITTGVIEGACRHLVQDRMGITGARWGLAGAQAMLWLRAINASGDTSTYWDWHIQQEHQRNHLSRYSTGLDLAA